MPGFKTVSFALLAVVGTYAAPFQKRGLDQVVSQCKHNFAYTFDGGPSESNSDLVEKFDSVGGKTTFFVNGDDFRCIYSRENVKALRHGFKQGHQYASNTWSHANLTQLNETQIDQEILRLDEAFVKILGVKPKLLRPPYDSIDERTASYIQTKHNKTIVLWDKDSGDNLPGANEQGSVDFFKGLAAEGAKSTHLTLSHEYKNSAVEAALDSTVDTLHGAGITLVTVADCLDIEPYEKVGEPGKRDDTWTCKGPWTPPSTSGATTPAPTTPASTPTKPVSSTSSGAPSASTTPSSVPPTTAAPSKDTAHHMSPASSSAPSTPAAPSSVPPTTAAPSKDATNPTSPTPSSAPSTSTTPSSVPPTTVAPSMDATHPMSHASSSAPSASTTPSSVPPTTVAPSNDATNPTSPTSSSAPSTSTAPSSVPPTTAAPSKDATIPISSAPSSAPPTTTTTSGAPATSTTPSSVPPTTTTSGVPPGPEPTCVTQYYQSFDGDTCSSIETQFALQAGSVSAANTWVNCSDIWTNTRLSICVPARPTSDLSRCTEHMAAEKATTCAEIGEMHKVSAAWIKAWNPWVNCADIWKGTQLCVAH